MSRMTFRTTGYRLGNMERGHGCSDNLIAAILRRGRRKSVIFQLLILAFVVATSSLLSGSLIPLVAADVSDIETLLELDPSDWASSDWVSIDPQKIIDVCTRALDNKPKLKDDQLCRLYFTRSIALYHIEKYEDSIRDLKELLKLHPKDCQALRYRGETYVALGQYDKARADFESVVKIQPKSGVGYGFLALLADQTGDYDSCKKFAEKAIALDPDEPYGYLARYKIRIRERDYKEALKDINKCILLSYGMGTAEAATPYFLKAGLFIKCFDNPKKGFPSVMMAYGLNPSGGGAKGLLCEYYFKTAKYKLAFQLSKQLATENPRQPELLGIRVVCLIERNRHEEALQAAESMVRQMPEYWGSYLYRGQVYFTQKAYKKALHDYDKALAQCDGDILPMTRAAKAYLLATCPEACLRDGPLARTLASKLCEQTENRVPRYLMLLAMASAECGDYKEAVRSAKKSLEKADFSFPYLTEYKRRLALFEDGKPYRFTPGSRTFDYLFP